MRIKKIKSTTTTTTSARTEYKKRIVINFAGAVKAHCLGRPTWAGCGAYRVWEIGIYRVMCLLP